MPVWMFLLAWQTADSVAEGIKALEAQNYPVAIQMFAQAVEKDPKDYYSQFHLALAYSGAHRDELAIEGYRKTLALKPKLYEAELNLGIVLTQSKRASEAIEPLEDALSQKPKEFRPAFHLAEAYAGAGRNDKAEELFKRALEAEAGSAPAEYGLARVLAAQGRFEEAAAHYRKAGAFDPQYQEAILELTDLYVDHKQPGGAIAIYKEFPQSPSAQERLGTLLIEQNHPEDAIGPLEFAVSKAPNKANRNNLIQAYLRSRQPEKALPLVNQQLTASPRDLDLYMLRGRIYRDQKNFKEAANTFYAATKLKPDSVEAWNEFSAMLISLEDYPQAVAALDKLRELNAETTPHFFFRAIILDKMKQPKPALEAYKRFLELAQGKFPDQEFQARQRVRIIEKELSKR